jgi:hypothetical protein
MMNNGRHFEEENYSFVQTDSLENSALSEGKLR